MRRSLLRMLAGLVLMAALSGCMSQKVPDLYSVMFSHPPQIYQKDVYAGSIKIGEIISRESGSGGAVKLSVSIQSEFLPMMTTHAVFYVSGGRLNRETVDSYGAPLPIEVPVLGFTSKLSLAMFRVKTLLTQSASVAGRQAALLSQQM